MCLCVRLCVCLCVCVIVCLTLRLSYSGTRERSHTHGCPMSLSDDVMACAGVCVCAGRVGEGEDNMPLHPKGSG